MLKTLGVLIKTAGINCLTYQKNLKQGQLGGKVWCMKYNNCTSGLFERYFKCKAKENFGLVEVI